mmetsp:Transcript_57875/g.134839  ORF Transcript_57875/g.134839 Transcript_57875/m.134839 type:complete len:156 (-) Transcript_57875:53-520(-)
MGAKDIAQLKPQFDELGTNLVLVGYEDVGAQEFLDGGYWQGEVFVDAPHAVFKALSTRSAGLWTLATPSVIAGIRRATAMGIHANQKGSNLDPTLGGTYVVNDGNFVYEYQHDTFADHAPGAEVLQACKHLVLKEGEMPAGKPSDQPRRGSCTVM